MVRDLNVEFPRSVERTTILVILIRRTLTNSLPSTWRQISIGVRILITFICLDFEINGFKEANVDQIDLTDILVNKPIY